MRKKGEGEGFSAIEVTILVFSLLSVVFNAASLVLELINERRESLPGEIALDDEIMF